MFHEVPNHIFTDTNDIKSHLYTDGDYALVHLLQTNKTYRELFFTSINSGREVILDNSVIELGEAFSTEDYVEWICKLNPTWYIIPDALGNYRLTIDNFYKFINYDIDTVKYHTASKAIGVVQGNTLSEMFDCFSIFHESKHIEMIALPFKPKIYEELSNFALKAGFFNDIDIFINLPITNLHKWVMGRKILMDVITSGYKNGIFHKKIHFLGCALPQEGLLYDKEIYPMIYSTDTSNPIISGIEGVRYGNMGLYEKSKTTIDDIINLKLNQEQIDNIIFNMNKFKDFWR